MDPKRARTRAILYQTYADLMEHYHHHPILKASPKYPYSESKEFHKLITSLMDQEVKLAQKHLEKASLEKAVKTEFFQAIEVDLDKIIYNNAADIQSFTKLFYDMGKEKGFSEMGVKAYTGNADIHALFRLNNYNFGLIKNLSNDLREGIRQEIWRGISQDHGMNLIARGIERLGLEPVQAGSRVIDIPTRALMIAKTESVRGVNQGLLLSFEEYGVTHVEVFRGSDYDDECNDYADESPYPIDNIPEGGPPFHPNCECTLLPAEDPASKPVDPPSYMDLVSGDVVDVPGDGLLMKI